jgi:xanthine dehydrogenase YagR molybdenum-binding subunit
MVKNDTHVGAPRNRVDGPAKVTGKATYAAEFTAPDLAYAFIVTSSIARGRITRIDVTEAEAIPGVIKVFTPENRPKTAWFSYNYRDMVAPPGEPFRPLYSDEIQFSGQPITLVVAESFDVARHAATLVRVAYEHHSHETNLSGARHNNYEPAKKRLGIAPPPKPRGDAVKAFSAAPVRVSAEYTIATEHHNPIEPHATTVVWEGDGKITVHDKTQGSYRRILVTAGPVRRRRLRAGVSPWRRLPGRRRTSHPGSVLATGPDPRGGATSVARPRRV